MVLRDKTSERGCVCGGVFSRAGYHGADFRVMQPPCWPSGKASASRAEDPGFESRL